MPGDLQEAAARAAAGETLSRAQAAAAMREIVAGEGAPALIASLLTALRMRGETPSEVAGFVSALREAAVAVRPTRSPLLDTCGTGGGGIPTFSISTTAAFVDAGAGVPVAKHGNRGMSSRYGSVDVLEALGIPPQQEAERIAACIDRCGIGFLFAQAHHPAMRHAAPVRRELPFKTVFNLLGPLLNPAGATRQVIGVFDARVVDLVAEALRELGHERAFVVHGMDGLDEFSTLGATRVVELRGGELFRYEIEPEEVGLPRARAAALAPGEGPREAAEILIQVLEGKRGPRREIVLLNAAAALVVAGAAQDLREGIARGAESIDSGAAMHILRLMQQQAQGEAAEGSRSR